MLFLDSVKFITIFGAILCMQWLGTDLSDRSHVYPNQVNLSWIMFYSLEYSFSNYDRYINIMKNHFPIIVSKEIIELKLDIIS